MRRKEIEVGGEDESEKLKRGDIRPRRELRREAEFEREDKCDEVGWI